MRLSRLLSDDETQILPVAVSPIVLASPYRERSEVPEVDAAHHWL